MRHEVARDEMLNREFVVFIVRTGTSHTTLSILSVHTVNDTKQQAHFSNASFPGKQFAISDGFMFKLPSDAQQSRAQILARAWIRVHP